MVRDCGKIIRSCGACDACQSRALWRELRRAMWRELWRGLRSGWRWHAENVVLVILFAAALRCLFYLFPFAEKVVLVILSAAPTAALLAALLCDLFRWDSTDEVIVAALLAAALCYLIQSFPL